MMGRQNDILGQFLYHFGLEDYVPEDHLLRLATHFTQRRTYKPNAEGLSAFSLSVLYVRSGGL